MGALDDAIREHLELKRRLGTSEDELKQKEDEAFGHGKPPPPPEPAADLEAIEAGRAPEAQVIVDDAAPETVEHEAEPEPLVPEAEVAALPEPAPEVAPAPDPAAEEFEPEEVLPEEGLEPAVPGEDVLEETPEFLEQAPDQDRLWFEQKPPKDFDFDD